MRTQTTIKERVFLTFSADDLRRVRPITARLRTDGGLALDHGLSSEPFAGHRGEIIRASLRTRLRHCTSTLCRYGARTADELRENLAVLESGPMSEDELARMRRIGAHVQGPKRR